MLLKLAVLIGVVLVLSFIGQQFADKHAKGNESFRKLFHIIHAIILAGLAFVVPLSWLIGLEVVFLISMVITRYLVHNNNHLLKSISYLSRAYKVGRISYGEFFYPVSIILLVVLAESKWEFAAAVLILGLGDAAAALVGKKYGKRTTYRVFGQKKSVAGSAVFFVITALIIEGFAALTPDIAPIGIGTVLFMTAIITLSENIGIYGSDNLLIPLATVLLLNAL